MSSPIRPVARPPIPLPEKLTASPKLVAELARIKDIISTLTHDPVVRAFEFRDAAKFLEHAIAPLKKDQSHVQEMNDKEAERLPDDFLHDVEALTATALREKYKSTYESWGGMKTRRKSRGAVVHADFMKFADFLRFMGPRPPGLTLDRIDPNDPEYAPGKVRWLDVVGQANNRGVTQFVIVSGTKIPVMTYARQQSSDKQEVKRIADKLRRRIRQGWTEEEVIQGKHPSRTLAGNPWNYRPWVGASDESLAENYYQKNGLKDEHPIEFAVRACKGWINQWSDHFDDHFMYEETDADAREIQSMINDARPRLKAVEELQLMVAPLMANPKARPAGWCGPIRYRAT